MKKVTPINRGYAPGEKVKLDWIHNRGKLGRILAFPYH